MDFFGAQAQARRQSRLLSWGFAACVAAVVLVINIIVLTVLRLGYARSENPVPLEDSLAAWTIQNPLPAFITTLIVGGFIGAASLFRMFQLREGGGYVARSVGGVRVERGTPDPKRRQLHNIVEEMALASGVPMPEVYVLEQEEGINAFAAGHTPANAAVAVTRGALLHLNRDQLQGVIAHEFSHILNGDMRLSIRLMGLVFGLMAVALVGRTLLRFSGASDKKGIVPIVLLGATIAVIGQIGFWGGRILQAWISRKRECLADASAVQFTRNAEGLRDALIRAAAFGSRGRYSNTAMQEVAHMLFVPGVKAWLATHPPLLERIRALDPHVNQGMLDAMIRRAETDWQSNQSAIEASATSAASDATASRNASVAVPAAAALIAATAGEPRPRHLDHAVAVRRALPAALRAESDAPERAQVLILALVACADPEQRDLQLQHITKELGQAVADEVSRAATTAAQLPRLLRLPAVLQLFPALRQLSPAERLHLAQVLQQLSRLDGRISVFEYALEKLVARGLTAQLRPREPHGKLALDDCRNELGVVFAVLACQGARNQDQARYAYEAGLAPLLPRVRPGYHIIDAWVPLFDEALDRLTSLQVMAKQLLVEGLVRTIAHDETLAPEEAELLRAICAVLECPLPPVLPDSMQ